MTFCGYSRSIIGNRLSMTFCFFHLRKSDWNEKWWSWKQDGHHGDQGNQLWGCIMMYHTRKTGWSWDYHVDIDHIDHNDAYSKLILILFFFEGGGLQKNGIWQWNGTSSSHPASHRRTYAVDFWSKSCWIFQYRPGKHTKSYWKWS